MMVSEAVVVEIEPDTLLVDLYHGGRPGSPLLVFQDVLKAREG